MQNIILENIAFLNEEHLTNVDVVTLDLSDFNQRFKTDIYLKYDVSENIFTPVKETILSNFFCSSINDLLFMVHNPTNNAPENWIDFINWKFDEYQNLETNQQRDIFKLRYTDYFPQGLDLNYETANFIKESFNTLISTL
ncbi:hypothetical protein HXZ94_15350 [Empedobacter falsenii]|uniref:hypothetical protein n=1 Tax=Empedobacter falsenii TaxID=343874 RepID=UPI002578DCE2|nr:hypothetical protein [Empedobacter falsenii]MDM1299871.1 hypothetical protein [Empedobacter falsenii]MDM1319679.1 hypothetical protein [Empedobacter falsenii]